MDTSQGKYQPNFLGLTNLVGESKTVAELTDTLSCLAKALGFEHFAYGQKSVWPITKPKVFLTNSYPSCWAQKYEANGYALVDPTVHHGLNSIEPILWSDTLFKDSMPLWEEARAHGLEHGWAQAVHNKNGEVGMLTLSRSQTALNEKELEEKRPYLSLLVQAAYLGFQKLTENASTKDTVPLSAREIEIIKWTAEGKTAYEIGEILGISRHTVNFHADNCVRKLNVANKTAAAVKAALLGLY